MSDLSWMDDAACRGHDPELWFPVEIFSRQTFTVQVNRALAICADCPVRVDCFVYGKKSKQRFGIWGGRIFK